MGKAKNLKKRVNSYTKINQLNSRIKDLVIKANKLNFQVLDSELEALLIEAELIRLHQPNYNVLLKDDKTPIYLLITNENYPRIIKIRKKEIAQSQKLGTILGPFASGYKLKEVLKIARRIFQWCDEAGKKNHQFNKACFYHQIQLCDGACINNIKSEDYQQKIANLILFLKGKKKTVTHNLQKEMKYLANELKFEQANKIKQQLQLIEVVTSKQYKLKPDLILPNLHQNKNENALIHLYQILANYLSLPKNYQFKRIEGYDVSNTAGANASVSMVVFTNGLPDKKQYRLFNIETLNTPNDYQMMKEALLRRKKHLEWLWPNLIVVDGGKGQVRTALGVFQENQLVIGLAKNPDRLVIPLKSNNSSIVWQIITLPTNHPALQLLQNIRDEAHRFAKKQHLKIRQKSLFSIG